MGADDVDEAALAHACTQKERAFAYEYSVDMNGTQAVLRSGCFRVSSPNSAKVVAWRLLGREHVNALVEVLLAQRAARANATQESVLHEMSLLAHSDIAHYVVDDDGHVQLTAGAPEGATRAIQSVKHKKTIREDKDGNVTVTHDVEIKLWDKPAPLKLMGRHVGLFPDKVEVTGRDGAPIQHEVTEVRRTVVPAPRLDELSDATSQKPETLH